MQYLLLDLEIERGADGAYAVIVRDSPAGQRRGTLRLADGLAGLQERVARVETLVSASATSRRDAVADDEASPEPPALEVVRFGRSLFDALFADRIRETYRRSRDVARERGRGLRLLLRIGPLELIEVPWELLYDEDEGDYVCLLPDTSLVRYVESPTPPPVSIGVSPPLSVLGVIASPAGLPPLDGIGERARVERAIRPLEDRGLVRLEWLEPGTPGDLEGALRRGGHHILHVAAHGGVDAGTGEGVVVLTDGAGHQAAFSATQLGRLAASHRSLRLVVLNTCLGARGGSRGGSQAASLASTLVRRGVPAVIAMQYRISDRTAVEQAGRLYGALATWLPVDAALADVRRGISTQVPPTLEWVTPVLQMRVADGMLFRPPTLRRSFSIGRRVAVGAAVGVAALTAAEVLSARWSRARVLITTSVAPLRVYLDDRLVATLTVAEPAETIAASVGTHVVSFRSENFRHDRVVLVGREDGSIIVSVDSADNELHNLRQP